MPNFFLEEVTYLITHHRYTALMVGFYPSCT
jgi:hypothetical protein